MQSVLNKWLRWTQNNQIQRNKWISPKIKWNSKPTLCYIIKFILGVMHTYSWKHNLSNFSNNTWKNIFTTLKGPFFFSLEKIQKRQHENIDELNFKIKNLCTSGKQVRKQLDENIHNLYIWLRTSSHDI